MADPTSIIGVLSASVHLAEKLYVYFGSFKDAPGHAADLMSEVVAVGHVLGTLRTRLEMENIQGSGAFARTSVLFFAVNGCKKRLEDIYNVLQPLVSNKTILKFWSRLRWPLEKDDTREAVASLHRYVQIFHFAVNLDGLAALSLSQHDALAQIQSRLGSIDDRCYGPSEAELQTIMTAIEHLPTMSAEIEKISKRVEELVIDRQLSQLLHAIPALAYQDRHRGLQITRMQGAGQWILDMPNFIDWRDGSTGDGTLWCNGAPGAGKTYLASVVIDYLEEFAAQANSPVLYFYFDYKLQSDQTPFKVLCTLLHQLLSTYSHVPREAQELFKRILKGKDLPSWVDLKSLFINLCNSLQTVFIVFDALDECDATANRGPIVELIRDIKRSRAQLLVTSRPYPPDIDELLGGCGQVLVEASDSDIRAYVLEQIARATHMAKIIDSKLREEIAVSIIAKSQGMFLLPALQINNILGQTNKRQIREALKALPSGLADNLAQTISRIKSQHAQSQTRSRLALKVLMWLSTVKRPLTVSELQWAIAVRADGNQLDDVTDPTFFVDCCFGLVAIDKETSVIRLVHFSVSEFLEERGDELFDEPDGTLAISCLSYILASAGSKAEFAEKKTFDELPFLDYAVAYWGVHAGKCSTQEVVGKSAELCSSVDAIGMWVQALAFKVKNRSWNDDGEWHEPAKCVARTLCPLHIAAVYGISDLAQDYIDRHPSEINRKDESGRTPLILAAICNQVQLIKLLLAQSDIDINAQDAKGTTALGYAAEKRLLPVAHVLLSGPHFIDINLGGTFALACQDSWGGPDQAAIISLLMDHPDLDVGYPDTLKIGPPWFFLARNWYLELLQRLVERPDFHPWRTGRPDPHFNDFRNYTRNTDYDVSFGLGMMDVPVITKLLETDPRFGFPSFFALELWWPFVFYAFSEAHNDEPYAKGHYTYDIDWMTTWDDGKHSWRSALRHSLTRSGISFESIDVKGRSFLHYLAQGCDDEQRVGFINFLLCRGIPVDGRDERGRTPLHYAARAGNGDAVVRLLDADADPFAVDNNGWTVLHLASVSKNEGIVQLLVSLGADLSAVTNVGESVLHSAAQRCGNAAAVLTCLLANGAPLEAQDVFRSTPLREAIWGSDEAFQTLLDRGANVSHVSMSGPVFSDAFHSNKLGKAKMCLAKAGCDLNVLNCFGMSFLDTLAQHKPSVAEELGLTIDWSSYEPTPAARRRRALLDSTRERIQMMASGNEKIKFQLRYRLGFQMLLLGDDASASILYEQELQPESRYGKPYFPDLQCSRCYKDECALFKCRSCAIVFLCEECKGGGDTTLGDGPFCVNHEYLKIPGDNWMSLPEGKVNHQGQTFDEWLEDLQKKYAEVEPDTEGETKDRTRR